MLYYATDIKPKIYNLDVASSYNYTDIQMGRTPFTMALDREEHKLFVVNQYDNSLSVINTTNRQVIETIPVGNQTQDIAYDNNSRQIFVASMGSKNISVIDGRTYKEIKQIDSGGNISAIYVDARGTTYVTHPDTNTITVIYKDGNQVAVPNNSNNTDSKYSSNLLDNTDSKYSSNLLDNTDSKYSSNLLDNTDSKYSSNLLDNTDSKYSSNLLDNTGAEYFSKPVDVTVDPKKNFIFVANHDDSTISVLNASNSKYPLIKKILVGKAPNDILINPLSRELYVINSGSDTLSIISIDGLFVKRTIMLGKSPWMLSFDDERKNGLIYATLVDANALSVINPSKNYMCEVKEVHVGTSPNGVMYDPSNKISFCIKFIFKYGLRN